MVENNMSCPVGCKYCMVVNTSRLKDWENGKNKNRYGCNKTALFVNSGLNEKELRHLSINKDFIKGEVISLNTNNDPFIKSQRDDILYMKSLYEDGYKYKLLNLVSKIPIHDDLDFIKELKTIPNLLVTYSVTGLDGIEKTRSIDRIESIKKLNENGINTHVLIHPYIYGLTDLNGVLAQLKNIGVTDVTIKGFRYSKAMTWLDNLIESEILDIYANNENQEVLVGEHYIQEQLLLFGIKNHDSLREFNSKFYGCASLDEKVAKSIVEELEAEVVFSSSAPKDEVLREAFLRRL